MSRFLFQPKERSLPVRTSQPGSTPGTNDCCETRWDIKIQPSSERLGLVGRREWCHQVRRPITWQDLFVTRCCVWRIASYQQLTVQEEEGAAAQFETTTPLCVAMQTISRQEVVVVCSLTQSADRDAAVTHSWWRKFDDSHLVPSS